MKFINYLQSINGVGIFPMISLLIFFIFFLVLGIWAVRVSKTHISELERIPLSDQEDGSQAKLNNHELN